MRQMFCISIRTGWIIWGWKFPKTYEELESVLEAFATQDADGDGDPTNEIGITGNVAYIP